jgi:hypothetical protein
VPEERGHVISVEKGTVMVGLPTGAVTLNIGKERVAKEDWRPGREAAVQLADDRETIESLRLLD